MVFNATFNNMSVITWWSVLLVVETGVTDKLSPGTLTSSTNKTDHHVITEILLKVALNTVNQTKALASNIKSCAYKDTFQCMYGAHKGSTDSSQYIPDTLRNIVTSWYSQRHSVINHCYRHITLLSDTDISFGLLNLFTYFDMPFG